MQFELLANDGASRRGRIHLSRGSVETPAFMPVGTYATVKAVTPQEVRVTGAEIILGNTFHLMLRPGMEVIARHGGLHRFMGWTGPILTDSGGFQVFSLAQMRKISEQGVVFRSPVDGSKVSLGPEESMAIQRALGSDIVMIFDDCTPYPTSAQEARIVSRRRQQAGGGIALGGLSDRRDVALRAMARGGIGLEGVLPDKAAACHPQRLEDLAAYHFIERQARQVFDGLLQIDEPLAGIIKSRPRIEVEFELFAAPVGQAGRMAHHHAGGDLPVASLVYQPFIR